MTALAWLALGAFAAGVVARQFDARLNGPVRWNRASTWFALVSQLTR